MSHPDPLPSRMTPKPAAHTPTPWTIDARGSVTSEDKQNVIMIQPSFALDFNDAAFIVRAVNSHEEMLSVLKEIKKIIHLQDFYSEFLSVVDKAIAKAEGK